MAWTASTIWSTLDQSKTPGEGSTVLQVTGMFTAYLGWVWPLARVAAWLWETQ